MSLNAAQEARRQLKPKSRRPGARGPSPSYVTGAQTPLFMQPGGGVGFTMPSLESFQAPVKGAFDFGGGQPAGISNPFAGSTQMGQGLNTNNGVEKRSAEGGEDLAGKKPFGGFSTTPISQTTSTSNIFGSQPAASTQTSKSMFGAPSTGSGFGNNAVNSPAPKFTFPSFSTQAQTQGNNSTSVFANLPAPSSKISFSASPASGNSNAPSSSQPGSSSFTFGQSQTQTPASQTPTMSASSSFPPSNSNTASIFSKPAAPASGSTLFSSATPATSQFKFGEQASNMFNTVASKPPSQPLFPTSLPTSSTSAAPPASSTNLFSGLSSGSTKPAVDIASVANTSSSEQTPKPFTWNAPAKTSENAASQTSSSQSLFANSAQKPAIGNLFGTATVAKGQSTADNSNQYTFGKSSESTPANKNQPATDSSSMFSFLKPKESTVGSNGTPIQQTNGTNGLFSSGSLSSTQESSKDSSNKPLFTFGQLPQASQPEKSSSEEPSKTPFKFGPSQPLQPSQISKPVSSSFFSNLNPDQNQTESNGTPKTSSLENNGNTAAKDSGSPSKPNTLFSHTFDSPKTATNSFMQKHKPVKPSPLSQSMSGSTSPDVNRSTNTSTFQGTSQMNANNINGLSSIIGSPSKLDQQMGQKDNVEKKEYDAAKRLRELSQAVKLSISRLPVTTDLSKLLLFYNTRRDEIMKDVSKAKRKAVDDGTNEDGSGPSATKRQRQNNGMAASTSTPNFVSSGESFKENDPPPSIQSPAKAPSRPLFESPSKQQPFINGSTTPRGAPPTNIFAAQALKTPTPLVSKEPPQTEKPKSNTSMFSAATSTVPRNPTAKTAFGFGSQPPQFSVPKTNGVSGELPPPKQATSWSSSQPSQTPLFASLHQSSASSPAKQPTKQAPQVNLFGTPFKQGPTANASSPSQQPSSSFAPSGLTSTPVSSTLR